MTVASPGWREAYTKTFRDSAAIRAGRIAPDASADSVVRAAQPNDTLVNLCSVLRSWRDRDERDGDLRQRWGDALTGKLPLPSASRLREHAAQAESLRRIVDRANAAIDLAGRRGPPVAPVYFEPGSDSIDMLTQALNVRRLAKAVKGALSADPHTRVTIEGAADPTGRDSTNERLAQRRAMRVLLAILATDNTIDIDRIDIVTHTPRLALNDTNPPDRGGTATMSSVPHGRVTMPGVADSNGFPGARRVGLRYAGLRTTPFASAPKQASELPSDAASRSPIRSASLTVALTDAVIQQAQNDLATAAVDLGVARLCRDELVSDTTREGGRKLTEQERRARKNARERHEERKKLTPAEVAQSLPRVAIPRTCALLNDRDQSSYQPNLSTFRAALRSDLHGYLETLLDSVIVRSAAQVTRSGKVRRPDEAVLALALTRYLRAIEDHEDVVAALETTARAMVDQKLRMHDSRVARAVALSAVFARAYEDTRTMLLASAPTLDEPPALRDSILLYTARTVTLNAADQDTNVPLLRALSGHTAQAEHALEMLVALEESLEAIRDLQARAQLPDRRAMAQVQLRTVAQLAVATARACMTDDVRHRVDLAAGTVQALHVALLENDYRSAMLALLAAADTLARLPAGTVSRTDLCFSPVPAVPAQRRAAAPATSGDYRLAALRREQDAGIAARTAAAPAAPTGDDLPLESVRPGMVRTLVLMVDLAQAESEGAMREALRSYIGAGGGYRAKRVGEPHMKAGMNAYLGGIRAWGAGNDAGIFLPVGIEVGRVWGDGLPIFRGIGGLARYTGLIVYPVDLGAIATLRVKQDDNDPENPTSAQIFAPGAAFTMSLGRLPVALGVNYQMRPRTDVDAARGFHGRYGVFLAADVPLLMVR